MSTAPTSPDPHAWQESLDPDLVARLRRPLAQPGFVPMAVVRRIFGWVDALTGRLPLLADLERRRGQAGARDTDRLPIVHARWVADDAPEQTWPDNASPSPRVVEVASGTSVSLTVNAVLVSPSVPAEPSTKEPLASPASTVMRHEAPVATAALLEAKSSRPRESLPVTVEREPEETTSALADLRHVHRAVPVVEPDARPSASAALEQGQAVVGTTRNEARVDAPVGAHVVVETVAPVITERRAASRASIPEQASPVIAATRRVREGAPMIHDLARTPSEGEPIAPLARPTARHATRVVDGSAVSAEASELPSVPVAAPKVPIVRPRRVAQEPARATHAAAAFPAESGEGERTIPRIHPAVRVAERSVSAESPAEARAIPLVRARAPEPLIGRGARPSGFGPMPAPSADGEVVSTVYGAPPGTARKQPLPRVAPVEPAPDQATSRTLAHVSTRAEATAPAAAQSVAAEPPFVASPEPVAPPPRAARPQVIAEPPAARRKDEIDIDKLVDTVQRKLLRRLATERERRGMR
ncbi:Cobalamin biosynthesis protein [Minicystis rosea]|nr:Cobalamin biosynthesis protein [Minicystis rosea]